MNSANVVNRLVCVSVAALCAASALAMPTQADLKKVQPDVVELMSSAMAEYQGAGTKEKEEAACKVGDASCAFAKEATTEAAKFMLLKGAATYYVRGRAYDKAGEALQTLKTEVKSVPPSVICEIVGKLGKISETKAPKLYAISWLAKLQVRAATDAKKLPAPRTAVNQRRYAEDLAISKDWAAAGAEFAKVNNAHLKKTLDAESALKGFERGDFWWTYEPALENADNFFRLYAASLYKKSLAANEIPGLKKNIVEKRLAGLPAWMKCLLGSGIVAVSSSASVKGTAWQENGNTATLSFPNGEKIKFVKCPKGKFNMLFHYSGNAGVFPTKLNYEFWMSDRVMTEAYELGVFTEKSKTVDDKARKNRIMSRDDFIDAFMNRLQNDYGDVIPAGLVFRLPSIAEFEYAYHANAKNAKDPYFSIAPAKDVIDRISSLNRAPGENEPNSWGLYDMICFQRFLDRLDPDVWSFYESPKGSGKMKPIEFNSVKDKDNAPFFWTERDDAYVMRLFHNVFKDRGATRLGSGGSHFRIVVGPDLVSEWKAKHGKK